MKKLTASEIREEFFKDVITASRLSCSTESEEGMWALGFLAGASFVMEEHGLRAPTPYQDGDGTVSARALVAGVGTLHQAYEKSVEECKAHEEILGPDGVADRKKLVSDVLAMAMEIREKKEAAGAAKGARYDN